MGKQVSPLVAHVASPKSCTPQRDGTGAQTCSQPGVCQLSPPQQPAPVMVTQTNPCPCWCPVVAQTLELYLTVKALLSLSCFTARGSSSPCSSQETRSWPWNTGPCSRDVPEPLVIVACRRKKLLSSLTEHSHWHRQHHKSCQGFPVWH